MHSARPSASEFHRVNRPGMGGRWGWLWILPGIALGIVMAGEPGLGGNGASIRPVLSATLSGHYDNNIYQQNRGPLAGHDSWVTALLPVVGVAMEGQEGPVSRSLRLAYEGDYRFFDRADTESYWRHGLVLDVKAAADHWQVESRANVQYTDGSTDSIVWHPPGAVPALGAVEIRNRRRHLQYGQRVELRRELGRVFARGVYDGRIWDFMIEQRPIPFYQNFVDRDDLNGGLDWGWKAGEPVEIYAGYRFGHQNQAMLPFGERVTYANTYHRALAGMRLRAAKRLEFNGEIGPSFHGFDADTLWPGVPDEQTLLHFRGAATLALPPRTTLRFHARQELIPSASGRGAYQNLRYGGAIEHRFHPRLKAGFSFTLEEFDFLAPTARWDRVFTPAIAFDYAIDNHLTLGVRYSYTWADSLVPQTEGREFDRHIAGFHIRAMY